MDFLLIKREKELGNSSCVVLEVSEAGPMVEAEVRKQARLSFSSATLDFHWGLCLRHLPIFFSMLSPKDMDKSVLKGRIWQLYGDP